MSGQADPSGVRFKAGHRSLKNTKSIGDSFSSWPRKCHHCWGVVWYGTTELRCHNLSHQSGYWLDLQTSHRFIERICWCFRPALCSEGNIVTSYLKYTARSSFISVKPCAHESLIVRICRLLTTPVLQLCQTPNVEILTRCRYQVVHPRFPPSLSHKRDWTALVKLQLHTVTIDYKSIGTKLPQLVTGSRHCWKPWCCDSSRYGRHGAGCCCVP